MVKVSVVVPTFRSDEGLDRLVASLDRQTLPTEDFEVILVDDGSPDDTFTRLQAFASTRPHFRAERIDNSGWPCRPRNVGADLALGEYIAFMDHDDELYPDALRAAYEFAVRNDADVVNGKEARTHDAEWAIDTYPGDEANSKGRADRHPLVPMNPHKLYRTAFLREHDIRFREDGRVYWEDIFFNLKVTRHAEVISTLASVPFYYWHTTPGSGSKGFVKAEQIWWDWLREVLEAIETDLAGEALALERRQQLGHQYRARLINTFDGKFAGRPEPVQDNLYEQCRALQAEFMPAELDRELNTSQRLRAELLRADRRDLLTEVAAHDPGIAGWGRVREFRWEQGRLVVTGQSQWQSPKGRRHALERHEGRLEKALPAAYREAVDPAILDMTDEVAGATTRLGVRSRSSRVTWMVPTESHVVLDESDTGPTFHVEWESRIDPETAVFGRPLEDGVWDVNARCTLGGVSQQQRVRSDLAPALCLDGSRAMIAYSNADGVLSVDLTESVKKAARVGRFDLDAATTTRVDGRIRVSVPLLDVDVVANGVVPTTVDLISEAPKPRGLARLRRRTPAPATSRVEGRIVAVGDVATLEFTVRANGGTVRAALGVDRPDGAEPWLIPT